MCTVKGHQMENILVTLGLLILFVLPRMMAYLSVSLLAAMMQLKDGICFHKMGNQIIYAGTMKYWMIKMSHFASEKQNVFLHRKIHPIYKQISAHLMICINTFIHCRDVLTMDTKEHQSKFHISVTNTDDTCLDASAGRRQTASEIRLHMFSACRWHAKQVNLCCHHHLPSHFKREDYEVLLTAHKT